MGPRKWSEWLRHRQQDERGAELIEFAIVIVLLLTVVYGMVAVGLSLAARESINQAVADGARFGIVQPLSSTGTVTSATETSSDTEAVNELGWLGLGACGTAKVKCLTDSTTNTSCPSTYSSTFGNMCVSSNAAACSANPTQTCLTVAVNYYYTSAPIFPLAPGLGLITPSDVSSSATMQVTSPT